MSMDIVIKCDNKLVYPYELYMFGTYVGTYETIEIAEKMGIYLFKKLTC